MVVHHCSAAKNFTCQGAGAGVMDGVGDAVPQTHVSRPFGAVIGVAPSSWPPGHVQPMDVLVTRDGMGV